MKLIFKLIENLTNSEKIEFFNESKRLMVGYFIGPDTVLQHSFNWANSRKRASYWVAIIVRLSKINYGISS